MTGNKASIFVVVCYLLFKICYLSLSVCSFARPDKPEEVITEEFLIGLAKIFADLIDKIVQICQ